MVIYIDTLVFLNTIIDYIILLLTCLITRRDYKISRLILASIIGGISSLYILAEGTPTFIDVIFKAASGFVIIIVAQRFTGVKNFLISVLTFLFISFLLTGALEFLETVLAGDVLNENFVSYFYISPLLLITFTIVIYVFVLLLRRFLERNSFSNKALLQLCVAGIRKEYSALIDTGNNLRDPLSESQVFVFDELVFKEIKESLKYNDLEKRRRVIPASTVSGGTLLEGIRCDFATIVYNNETVSFNRPIIACSQMKLSDEKVIISYTSLNRLSDKRGII